MGKGKSGSTAPSRHLEGGHPKNYDEKALPQPTGNRINSNGAKGTYKAGQLRHPVSGENLATPG